MSDDQRFKKELEFIKTCVALEFLNETDADALHASARKDGEVIAQTALQRGLLTPIDVDIVQSLQRPTEVVPGYKILNLIGKGGMGVVYRAEQLDLEKIVALKTILISYVHDSTLAARFEREAKAVARLQHPSIVQAFNFGKHEGRYYFAMEYVPGLTCEQALREVTIMPDVRVWSIVRQVASGLMHALKQNIIHRDIKPANLLLLPPPDGSSQETEMVKIADFGLAMFADQGVDQMKLTTGEKILGSPTYMSLEQFAARKVDFRSDIYSLGATAWHLLFGTPPFRCASVAALYQQKSERMTVDPSTLPIALPEDQLQLLADMLDPDPAVRPQRYEQLIDAIDALGVFGSATPIRIADKQTNSLPRTIATDGQATTNASVPVAATLWKADTSRSLDETIELPKATLLLVAGPLKLMIAVAVAGMMIASLFYFSSGTTRGLRTHTRIIGSTPLFDGVTLSGWDVGGGMVGAWNTVEDPDSSTAIACTTQRGALTRRFPVTPNARISIFVWLQPDSGPVDIDFAFDPTVPSDVRASLRMSGDSNQLGEKLADFDDVQIAAESDALPTVYDRYHVVHIERQPTDWYVFLEDKLIGTLPVQQVGDGSAIRLVVHGGENPNPKKSNAFFADVQLYEMRPKDAVDENVP
ncbi:MAG: protein kinase [Pirellulaceae bacterium]